MEQKYIRVDRQSVCMGDDYNAPNEKRFPVGAGDLLSDVFGMIEGYLPQMDDVIWAVDSGKKVIGYIVVDLYGRARYEFCVEDQLFGELDIEALHCSYFHRRSFEYRNGNDDEIVEKYSECRTLFDKVKRCMEERFLYELEIKGGSLCIWGEWFGRPHDNFHIIETVRWRKVERKTLSTIDFESAEAGMGYKNEVVLRFKEGEFLSISDPVGIVNEKGRLVIRDAAQIIWTWYLYDREHTYENLYVRQYIKNAEGKIMRAEGKRHDIKSTDGTVFYPTGENAVCLE